MEVSRETFIASTEEIQNLLLFDSIREIHLKLDSFNAGCSDRHKQIDDKIITSGRINKAVSAGSGALSGFLAVVGAKFFGV